MNCEEILDTAKGLITGDRHEVYGSAEEDFTRTGKLWEQVFKHPVSPEEVALCMALVKVSRLCNSVTHEDSWVDAVGYIALGGEIATKAPESVSEELPQSFYDHGPKWHDLASETPVEPPDWVPELTDAEKHWEWEGGDLRWRYRDGWQYNAVSNFYDFPRRSRGWVGHWPSIPARPRIHPRLMNYHTKGWLVVGGVVLVIEAAAPPGQTLSEGVDEGLKHPIGRFLIPFLVLQCALHLLNKLPLRWDLFHIAFKLLGAMLKRWKNEGMVETSVAM